MFDYHTQCLQNIKDQNKLNCILNFDLISAYGKDINNKNTILIGIIRFILL